MSLPIKADTVTEVVIGPAVAVGDGFTPVTGLTVASADEAEIIKHGATTGTGLAGTLAAISGADGYYALDLSTGETDTEGRLVIVFNDDSLILPIRHEFIVYSANVYDSLFGAAGVDVLDVSTTQFNGGALPAPAVTGVPDVNVTHQGDGAIPAPAVTGVPDVNTTHIQDGLVPTPATAGIPDVNVAEWVDTPVTLSATSTKPEVDVNSISDDATAANNVEADYDGTGFARAASTIGTVTTNSDMRGTENAALASVLGALADAAADGDPSATETVMQYAKQIINTLEGAAGIPAFPAEGPPANGTSLAEVIRAMAVDVAGLNGDVMAGTDDAFLAANAPTNFSDLAVQVTTGEVTVGAMNAGVIASGVIAAAELTNIENEILDAPLSSHLALASIGQVLNGLGARTGAVADAGPLVGDFDVDGLTEATDDHFNGSVMTFTTGPNTGASRVITDYTGAGQNMVFAEPWVTLPVDNDEFVITNGAIMGTTLAQIVRLFITILNASTGQLDAGSLTAGTVDAAAIATDAIDDDAIATGAVASTAFAAGAINAAAIAANAIEAGKINTGAITAAKFAAGAIDAAALNADAVDKIRDGLLPTQNVAYSFDFLWVAASDHVTPVTAASTTSVTRSIDGGSFSAGGGTITETANGIYEYAASAGDMNGGRIVFRFVATGGTPGAPDDTFVEIVTGGGV